VLLLQDFCGTVRAIAKFLEKPLSESQLRQLEQHCSFDNMRNNDSVNYSWNRGIWSDGEFLRKGWNTAKKFLSLGVFGTAQVESPVCMTSSI